MAPSQSLRWDVASADRLEALAAESLPGTTTPAGAVRSWFRDVYLDTADGSLGRRAITCRFRVSSDDRRSLALFIAGADVGTTRHVAASRETDWASAIRERTGVARRLAGIVDPSLLVVRVALEVERIARRRPWSWIRRACGEVHFETVTVRRGESVRAFHQVCAHAPPRGRDWLGRIEAAFTGHHGLRPVGLSRAERAELLLKWLPAAADPGPAAGQLMSRGDAARPDDGPIDPELSFLASQERVLDLAARPQTPLAERLRFLSIVAGNVDEFFSVRVAGLKLAAPEQAEESDCGVSAAMRLADVGLAVRALVRRQQEILDACLASAAAHGGRIRAWHTLAAAEQERLRERFRHDTLPALTPLAMTLSPGHPFPRLPHLSLSIAVVLRDGHGPAPRLAQIEIPDDLPRFVPVAEDESPAEGVVLVEEVIRHNLDLVYPSMHVEQAHCVRVTRGSELALDEEGAVDLLEAVGDAARRRMENGVVRVEIEAGMPHLLRELVVEELRREPRGAPVLLDAADVFEVRGMLDLRRLTELPLPPDPALRHPPFVPEDVVLHRRPLLDVIADGDLLVHHPFESFTDTVVRFVREAAADPDVTVLKMTLYRVGERSPIVEALRAAARAGKQVYAFVELRARFDEERNVKWVRALEKAGVHVTYGLVGLKTHAKAALVVRREGAHLRRYVHVGSGNYNPQTGLAYTDLSLFSADDALADDITTLFNGLTGSSRAASGRTHGALIAPAGLLPGLLDRIDREAAHARAGRTSGIGIKVNGLADAEVVDALGRASQDGVPVDLIVRGICTLRPGVPGRTTGIRVIATAGRFLEHSRIYRFENDGAPEHYIGSADLRPRNLRRRVELLVPVRDPAHRGRLDGLLAAYSDDPTAWELDRSGVYRARSDRAGARLGVQDELLRACAAQQELTPSAGVS